MRKTLGHGPGGVVDLAGADRVSGVERLRLSGAPLLHARVVEAKGIAWTSCAAPIETGRFHAPEIGK